jgi:hypothetical protein
MWDTEPTLASQCKASQWRTFQIDGAVKRQISLHWFDGVLAHLGVQLLAFAFFMDTRTRDE